MTCVPVPTGWSPGRNTGESERAAAERLLTEYPGTTAIRKFFDTATISATDGLLAADLPEGLRVALSVPGGTVPSNAGAVVGALADRGLCVDWIQAHEPEKKITPAAFLAAHVRLNEIFPRTDSLRVDGTLRIATAMTVQRARIFAPEDLRRFVTPDLAKLIDVMGWDWYPSYDNKSDIDHYEDPAEATALMLSFREEIGVEDWGFYEIHHGRMKEPEFAVTTDTTGVGCAQWMLDTYAYSVQNGCVAWLHFHTSGGRLTVPGAVREPEYAALRDMITSSSSMGGDMTPDPAHPQYVFGYEAGWKNGNETGRRELADRITTYVTTQRP